MRKTYRKCHDPFDVMLKRLRIDEGMNLSEFAKILTISPQYLHDLEHRRRLPSVKVVRRICDFFKSGPRCAVVAWHRAGAKAHGWDI
jgi:transcriptional regulator with XRE-family HTH domain